MVRTYILLSTIVREDGTYQSVVPFEAQGGGGVAFARSPPLLEHGIVLGVQ